VKRAGLSMRDGCTCTAKLSPHESASKLHTPRCSLCRV